MKRRLFLVEWDLSAARTLTSTIRIAGWEVEVESKDGARAVARMQDIPPDVVLVDFSNKPTHGRQIVEALQEYEALRDIPVLAIGGSKSVQEEMKNLGVDVVFTSVIELGSVLGSIVSLST